MLHLSNVSQVQNSLWHLISAVLLYCFFFLFFVFFFLHIFLLFSLETQSANIELSKNKVPKKTKQKKTTSKIKWRKKTTKKCILCSQPTAKIFRTILGWLSFLVEIILICIPNLWVELYCM